MEKAWHEQQKYPSGFFGEVDDKTELGERVGEMLVKDEGEGKPSAPTAVLIPVKGEGKGRRIGQEEPQTAVQPRESLSQASRHSRAKTVHQRSPKLGRNGPALESPLYSVIGCGTSMGTAWP